MPLGGLMFGQSDRNRLSRVASRRRRRQQGGAGRVVGTHAAGAVTTSRLTGRNRDSAARRRLRGAVQDPHAKGEGISGKRADTRASRASRDRRAGPARNWPGHTAANVTFGRQSQHSRPHRRSTVTARSPDPSRAPRVKRPRIGNSRFFEEHQSGGTYRPPGAGFFRLFDSALDPDRPSFTAAANANGGRGEIVDRRYVPQSLSGIIRWPCIAFVP